MSERAAEQQLDDFLSKYTPEMVAQAHDSLRRLRAQVPGAVELVYDNYNSLVVGFGATERPSDAVLSLAFMPRWVTLCFLYGMRLPDPHGMLRGEGSQVRSIQLLEGPEQIDRPEVRDLIWLAVADSDPPFDPSAQGRMVIRSISAKQRPRRPPEGNQGAR